MKKYNITIYKPVRIAKEYMNIVKHLSIEESKKRKVRVSYTLILHNAIIEYVKKNGSDTVKKLVETIETETR